MFRHLARALCAACFLTALSVPARAIDAVHRKSTDKPAQGEITEITKEFVKVEARIGEPVKVPAGDIARVDWDGEPPKLRLARAAESGGRLQDALEGYREALDELESDNEHLQADLEFLIARATAKQALADPQKREEAVGKLEEFRKEHPNSFRYYAALNYLAEVHLAGDEFTRAQSILTLLEQAPQKDYKMAARIATARLALAQGNPGEALSTFDEVIQMPAEGAAETARRYEAMLGKATCLQKQGNNEEALQMLKQVVNESSPENTGLQANAYLRQGDVLRELGRTMDAVLAYLHVDVLFPMEKQLHAEALYRLSQVWKAVGKPERAAEAAATLESEYPNSKWTGKLSSTGA